MIFLSAKKYVKWQKGNRTIRKTCQNYGRKFFCHFSAERLYSF